MGDDENRSKIMTQPPILTGQDIAEAFGAVQGAQERALAAAGGTSREYVVLRVLAERGPFESPADLHEFLAGQRQLALTPAAANELLVGLQARGLVSGHTQLTPAGAETLGKLRDAQAPAVRQLYAGMDPGDLATARRVLRQITDQAERFTG
jgi:DNA-binding MarR family transcriptional regulator